MQETKNYKLKKPDLTDIADIREISKNMDIIDAEIEKAKKTVKTCRYVVGTSTDGWTEKECDYLCDGIDDQEEINSALAALPLQGGEVVILDGTYNISDKISFMRDNTTLSGCGDACVIEYSGSPLANTYTSCITMNVKKCIVQNLLVRCSIPTPTASTFYQHVLIKIIKDGAILRHVTCDKKTKSGDRQRVIGIQIDAKSVIIDRCILQGDFFTGIDQDIVGLNCIIRGCTIDGARCGISGYKGLIALYNLIATRNDLRGIGIGIYAIDFGKGRTMVVGNMIHTDGRGIDCGAIRGGLISNNIIIYTSDNDLNYKSIYVWCNINGKKSKNALVVNNVLHQKDVEIAENCENITTANNKVVEGFE